MGGMKFNSGKLRGTKRKELGPITCCSIAPTTSYQELLEKGIKEFFPSSDNQDTNFFWQIPKVVSFLMTLMGQLGHWVNIFTLMDFFHLKRSYIVFK